jgi:SagB-type dehydrogenase family enzyme
MKKVLVISGIILSSVAMCLAAEPIQLQKPNLKSGRLLMEALKDRQTQRSFDNKRDLSNETLSNLLWAAFGINRDNGKRTAPSAMNWQEVEIYVAMKNGVFLYDAEANQLVPYIDEDIRPVVGMQGFVKDAPVSLIYVADYSKMTIGEEMKTAYAHADVSFISQNVYLFCASEGLATVILGSVNTKAVEKKLNLPKPKKIIFAQPVGYPK